jgi:hypothetical protein
MSNEKALVDAANRVGFAIQCDHEGMPYPRVEKSIESLKAAAILYAEEKIAEQIAAWIEKHEGEDEFTSSTEIGDDESGYSLVEYPNLDAIIAAIRSGAWRK